MPVGRGLDLKGEAQPEQAPNVDLLVPALIVAHGGSDLEQAVASQHHQDGGKKLADHALLDRCYWHVSITLAWSQLGTKAVPASQPAMRVAGSRTMAAIDHIGMSLRAGSGAGIRTATMEQASSQP